MDLCSYSISFRKIGESLSLALLFGPRICSCVFGIKELRFAEEGRRNNPCDKCRGEDLEAFPRYHFSKGVRTERRKVPRVVLCSSPGFLRTKAEVIQSL